MFHEELAELFGFIKGEFKKKSGNKYDNANFLEDALKQLHSCLNKENSMSVPIFIHSSQMTQFLGFLFGIK